MTLFEKICIALIALIAGIALYGSITEKSPETRGTLYISGERMCEGDLYRNKRGYDVSYFFVCDDGRKISALANFEVRQ